MQGQGERTAHISVVEMVFTVLATVVASLTALATLGWWIYRRGQAAGTEKAESIAKIAALERALGETRAQLTALQAARQRT